MEQASNYLNEASRGEYGEELAAKVQERTDWVIDQVKGDRVLDIGCNQGHISIKLANAGKNVTGIDVDADAIDYAENSLKKEPEKTKQRVTFQQADLLKDKVKDSDFDTVILSEVLEQYETIQPMLDAACERVKDGGTIIITVPFGINIYSDQKKTFYFQEIYQKVKQFFKVNDAEFVGDSIGLVGIKSTSRNRGPIPQRYIKRLEEAFYRLERELIDKKTSQEEAIRQLKQEKERLQADLLAAELAVQEQTPESTERSPVADHDDADQNQHSIFEMQSENKALKQEVKELFETNEALRKELKTSAELNRFWEKELNRLRADFRKLDEKWAKKFHGLKKQYQAIVRGYKLYVKRLKKTGTKNENQR